MSTSLTTEQFIDKAKKEHGDRYDYSKSVYTRSSHKVTITCSVHGDFQQSANSHLMGSNCFDCVRKRKRTQQDFLDLAKAKHGDKYDYSKSVYLAGSKQIKIICRKHGEFSKRAENHLLGQGCKKCNIKQSVYDTAKFIEKATRVHKGLYTYERSDYIKTEVKLTITCRTHGDFEQKAGGHLSGQGCSKCYRDRVRK
jgi:hypothetical protein